MDSHRSAVDEAQPFEAQKARFLGIGGGQAFGLVDRREIKQAMRRPATLGRNRFGEARKIGGSAPELQWSDEGAEPLPPRDQALADENLDRPRNREAAHFEPPRKLRLAIDAGAGLPRRDVLPQPVEELQVERPIEFGLESGVGGQVTRSYG